LNREPNIVASEWWPGSSSSCPSFGDWIWSGRGGAVQSPPSPGRSLRGRGTVTGKFCRSYIQICSFWHKINM